MRPLAIFAVAFALFAPATADAHCRRFSNRAELGAFLFHARLFSTTLTGSWCYAAGRVTRLGRVRLYPALSTLGTLASWEYRGVVERDQRLLRVGVRRRAGYRVQRVVDWRRCAANCHHVLVELNSYLYADGRALRFNRVLKR